MSCSFGCRREDEVCLIHFATHPTLTRFHTLTVNNFQLFWTLNSWGWIEFNLEKLISNLSSWMQQNLSSRQIYSWREPTKWVKHLYTFLAVVMMLSESVDSQNILSRSEKEKISVSSCFDWAELLLSVFISAPCHVAFCFLSITSHPQEELEV